MQEENGAVRFAFEQGRRVGEAAKVYTAPRAFGMTPLRFVMLDDGEGKQRVQLLDDGLDPEGLPVRIEARPVFKDVGAFVEYLKKYREVSSVVFMESSVASPRFLAILDYHCPTAAQFCVHQAVLELTPTAEWRAWSGSDRKDFGQLDFALFLEENAADVVKPSGAEMLEMAKTLEATQGVDFKSRVVLENGDSAFTYDVTTNATAGGSGKMEIPGTFEIRLSPFVGIPAQQVECRFRYLLRRPSLTMGYMMIRKEQLVRRLVQGAADVIKEETGLPVWEGVPTQVK